MKLFEVRTDPLNYYAMGDKIETIYRLPRKVGGWSEASIVNIDVKKLKPVKATIKISMGEFMGLPDGDVEPQAKKES